MPIGPFPDFDACVAHMMKPREEGGGGYDEETARKVCGKMKAELEESFSWASDLQILKPYRHLIRGEAIHPIKTLHLEEWPSLRVYLEEELERSAQSLIDKPLFLDHWRPLHGSVLGAHYENGAIEYVADLHDEEVLQMIRDGQIKHASVQFEWKSLENVNGVAPRGITFQHLSLLKDVQPGDPQSTVEIWESIARQLKEAKGLALLNPKGSKTDKERLVAHFGQEVATKLLDLIGEQAYKLLPERGTRVQKRRLLEESEKAKKTGEAIITSNVTTPAGMISKIEIIRRLREAVYERVPHHWGYGPYEQNRKIKRLIRELESSRKWPVSPRWNGETE